MIIQGIIIIFVLFAVSRLILRFKDSSISAKELVIWSIFWSGVIVITIIPEITDFFAKLIGIGRGVDAIIYMAIILLFYAIFRIGVKLENIESDITKLVRREALKKENK